MEVKESLFLSLPREVILHVMSFLTEKELVITSRVSTLFADIARDNSLWKKNLLFNFHKHISQMFDLPNEENHYLQARGDHIALKKFKVSYLMDKMKQAATKGNLLGILALCHHGFSPDYDCLEGALRSKQDDVVKFIVHHFFNKICHSPIPGIEYMVFPSGSGHMSGKLSVCGKLILNQRRETLRKAEEIYFSTASNCPCCTDL